MRKEIQREADKWGISIALLSSEQATDVKKRIREKYTDGSTQGVLWGHLVDYAVLRDSYAWAIVDEFIDWEYEVKGTCLLFFNDEDEENIFVINNGRDLYKILSETCENKAFYLTDFDTKYLLSFNRYDCLYGVGAAKDWVSKMFRGG